MKSLKNLIKNNLLGFILVSVIMYPNNIFSQTNGTYEKKPWSISFGVNSIFEDREQFIRYFNNEAVLWNVSPITFGVEKKINKFIGINGLVGSNQYPENQRINGASLTENRDVVFADMFFKFNLLEILKYKSDFEPYLTAGVGYLSRSESSEISINLGGGFNYWLSNKYAIGLGSNYKMNRNLTNETKFGDFLQLNLMLIQVID